MESSAEVPDDGAGGGVTFDVTDHVDLMCAIADRHNLPAPAPESTAGVKIGGDERLGGSLFGQADKMTHRVAIAHSPARPRQRKPGEQVQVCRADGENRQFDAMHIDECGPDRFGDDAAGIGAKAHGGAVKKPAGRGVTLVVNPGRGRAAVVAFDVFAVAARAEAARVARQPRAVGCADAVAPSPRR